MNEQKQDNVLESNDIERLQVEQSERREVRIERHAVEILVKAPHPPVQVEGEA